MITYIIIGMTVVLSFVCFNNRDLWFKLSLSPYDVIHENQWYRVVSHAFVHGDYTHLFINMIVLWSFGSAVENTFNDLEGIGYIPNARVAFLLLYFGGTIFSSIPDVFKHKNNIHYRSIGASGAVSAVVFAFIFFAPWSKIYLMMLVPVPAVLFGAAYLWYSHYMSRRNRDNINHMAHFYGAVFGFIFPVILKPSLIHFFLVNVTKFQN